MKTLMFSIQDSKSGLFSVPFFSLRKETATREFQYIANDKNSQIGKFPADFNLFQLGEFDDETGLLTTFQPEYITSAVLQQFIAEENKS